MTDGDNPTGWQADLLEADYHADRTRVSSGGVRLALRSARAFHREKVLGCAEDPTPAMIFGQRFHRCILEPDVFARTAVVQPDFGDRRLKANKEAYNNWVLDIPTDAEVVTSRDHDRLTAMQASIAGHRTAAGLLRDCGIREAAGWFTAADTGLACRIKPDFLSPDFRILGDLKSTTDCSRNAWRRTVWGQRYDVQMAFYALGVQAITGVMPTNWVWIAVDSEEPFDCAVYLLDDVSRDKAMQDCLLGLQAIRHAVRTDCWPGQQADGGAQDLTLPEYAFQ